MKLIDLFEKDNNFDAQNSSDHSATEVEFLDMFGKYDFGKSSKIKKQKVLIKDTRTGKVYGAKTLWQRVID
jgi:hypothetical protein